MKNITNLMENSIRIYAGISVRYPQFGKEESLNVSDLIPKFPGCYATNNSTVAFVWEDNFYVAPYTRENISILEEAGLTRSSFYVPFSNWDYPICEKSRWDKILEDAEVQREVEFVEDCESYCDEHGFGKLTDEALSNCFRIPNKGVRVKYPAGYESTVRPMISRCLDCTACDRIGTYCTNNGRVVFVYRNGGTYVTKGYSIVRDLQAAGYRESSIFVPFSNGEEILDFPLRTEWESVQKK